MRKIFKTLIIAFAFAIAVPFSVNAISLEILSIDVTNNNGTLTVKGQAEEGVLAVAVVVVKEGESSPEYIQTCAYNEGYNCELSRKFEAGKYVVKVADYAGGDYISKKITVGFEKEVNPNPEKNTKIEENPKTGDNIISYIIIGSISLISLIGCGLYIYKKKKIS